MDEPKINSDQPWKKKPLEPAAPDVEQQEFDREKQLDQTKCAQCGVMPPEPGQLVPLCTACRNKLSRYPVPMPIIIGLIVVLALTVVAFTQFPRALKAGVAFSKGEKLEKAGKYADAYDNYIMVLNTYKNSTQLFARMAVTAFKAKEYDIAGACINKIAGREVSKSLLAEINPVIAGLNAYYKVLDGAKNTKPAPKKPSKKKKGGAR